MPEGLDIGQVIIIVIAVVAGFLQWAWKIYQQSKGDRERARQELTDEERRLREEAWQRQTGQAPPPLPRPAAPQPSPTATPPPQDPWRNLRDIFETVKEEMRKAQEEAETQPSPQPSPPPPRRAAAPPPPPPRPVQAPAPPPLPTAVSKPAWTAPPPVAAIPSVAPAPSATALQPAKTPALPALPREARLAHLAGQARESDDFAPLRALLASRDSVRQGILLREILGPPKALQSFGDTPF